MLLIFIMPQQIRIYLFNVNRKFNDATFCIVKKVYNRNLLVTEKSCLVPNDFKGTYFISKTFLNKNRNINSEESKLIDFTEKEDILSDESKQKIKKARSEMFTRIVNLNYQQLNKDNIQVSSNNRNKALPNLNKTLIGLIDFGNN